MNLAALFGGPTDPAIDCGGRLIVFDQPRIMAVLNRSPDSFSDGGAHAALDAAVRHALRLVAEGADLLDIGGESTRPGATAVSVQVELDRVLPLIERLRGQLAVPISIDTSKPAVMRAAVAAGAGMINDVRALRGDGALAAAAELGVPVCLMHMQGAPASMQDAPHYEDVLAEVKGFLAERLFACQLAGIDKKQLLIDPGFGFGKTRQQNLALLAGLRRFADLGCPILVGLSRKRLIGEVTGRELDQRLHGSVAAALLAVERGAAIVRVHDVGATRDALAMLNALAPYRALAVAGKPAKPTSPTWDDDA
jgi:dihydropteroate synthase